MTQLSRNFFRSEFSCRCGCGFDTVDSELIIVLQSVRDHYGASVTITSGCRCSAHNKRVAGSKKSKHLEGRAADIVVAGVAPSAVYQHLVSIYPDKYGIGKYSTFTHIDTRTGAPARW